MSKLIWDTKIWISSEGINRTLADAISDRAIGLKGTAGASIKDQSIFIQDNPVAVGTPISAGFNGTALLRNDDEEFTFLDSFTIAGWVYLTDKTSDMTLINRWADLGNQQYRIKYNSASDRFEFEVNKANNTQVMVFDATSPALNTWYFISCRFNKGTGIDISVNDGVLNSSNFTDALLTNAVAPLYMGGANGVPTGALLGNLDSWTFLNRLATDTEVSELYNLGNGKAYETLSVPLKQGLIGHWDLDEGDGQNRKSKGKRTYNAINFELVSGGQVVAASGITQPYRDDNQNVLGAFINSEGNTEIAVPWNFRIDSLIYANIGLKHWIEYESDTITPDAWFRKKPNSGTIEFFGNIIASTDPVVIVSLEGVPPPSAAIELVSGLKPKFEAYGNTKNLNQSTNVSDVQVVNGRTRITFNSDIDVDNLQVLYVNNEFWPRFKPEVIAEKYFQQISVNTIELDQDYSFYNHKFYFAEFFEKGVSDDFGNVCIPLKPYFRTFGVSSPNLTSWAIGVNDSGEIVTNDTYDIISDPIRFRRDDSLVVAIEVDNNGDLIVNQSPVGGGILFDDMFFQSPNGSIFSIGVDNTNKLYTEDRKGQRFCVKDKSGNELYQVQKYSKGTTLSKIYYPQGAEPPVREPDDDNETLFCFIEYEGVPSLHFYNPLTKRWELSNISKGGKFLVGETVESILDETQFREEYGPYWYKLDGTHELVASNFPELLEVCPFDWYDEENDRLILPDYQRYDYEAQSGAGPRGYGRIYPPEGCKIDQLMAGITSIRRIYFAGDVDGNDTLVNDHLIDIADGSTYARIYNSEERGAAYSQHLNIFKRRFTNVYIKVK